MKMNIEVNDFMMKLAEDYVLNIWNEDDIRGYIDSKDPEIVEKKYKEWIFREYLTDLICENYMDKEVEDEFFDNIIL